jgi:hypothetical protein
MTEYVDRKRNPHVPTDERAVRHQEFYQVCRLLLDLPLSEDWAWDAVAEYPEVAEVVLALWHIREVLVRDLRELRTNYESTLPKGADKRTKNEIKRADARLNNLALSLVEALCTGGNHPIFSFVRGCRSYKSSHPAEIMMRSSKPYIFGAYRAIRELHGMSQRQASALVSAYFSERGITLAPQTIKDRDEKLPREIYDLANRFRDLLLRSREDPEQICARAFFHMEHFVSLPHPSRRVATKAPG